MCEDKMSAIDEKTIATIERVGWQVMFIFDDEDRKPCFHFTVGLYASYGHPELIIFGLGPENGMMILNGIGTLIKEGRELEEGILDIGGKCPMYVKVVSKKYYNAHLGQAIWYYEDLGKGEFPCFQIVCPDTKGRLPFDENCDDLYKNMPQLWDV